MKIIKSFIFISALLVLVFSLFGRVISSQRELRGSIYAQGGIKVELEDDPLFYESNFLPGDSVTKQVKVINESWFDQEVGLRLENSENFLLAEVLLMAVRDAKTGEELLSPKSLFDLYNASQEEMLFSLGPKRERLVAVEVQCLPEAGDVYQGESTKFDLTIGFIAKKKLPPSWPEHGPCPSWSAPGRCFPWPVPGRCSSWQSCF